MPNKAIKRELTGIYNAFSETFFDTELPIPAIKIKSKNRFVLRFFPKPFELVVGTLLPHQSPLAILDETLHQCCHVFNHIHGVKDLPNYQYHNKKFATAALAVGLVVARDQNLGWISCSDPQDLAQYAGCECFLQGSCPCDKGCLTFPDEAATQQRKRIYDKLFREINFEVFKNAEFKANSGKNFFLKYECGCEPPYNSIRSGRRPVGPRALQVRCEVCGQLFECVEQGYQINAQSHGGST